MRAQRNDIIEDVGGGKYLVVYADDHEYFVAWTDSHPEVGVSSISYRQPAEQTWVKRIVRDGVQVFPEPEPKFKFGDKIIRNDCPREEAVVGVYVGNGKVVFDYESGPSLTELYRPERFKVID